MEECGIVVGGEGLIFGEVCMYRRCEMIPIAAVAIAIRYDY